MAASAAPRTHGGSSSPVGRELGDDGADAPLMPFKVIPEYRVCGIKFNRRRRICLFVCCGVALVLVAVAIPLLIFVIVPKIAQAALAAANMTLGSTSITNISNTTFTFAANGSVTNAGFIDASVSFDNPVSVYWVKSDGTSVAIGQVPLPDLSVSGSTPKSGTITINDATFTIIDVDAMGTFAQSLVTSDSFTWRLVGTAHVKALGLNFNGISIDKSVTLVGFDGFKDVSIESFNLPSSDPTKGITLNAVTRLGNPSVVTIEVGSLYFNADFMGAQIGTVSVTNVTLRPGNNYLNLTGYIKPIDANATELLSEFISYFVGGESSPMTVVNTNVICPNGPVAWLQKGLIGVALTVSLSQNALKLVSNISIPSLAVTFDPADTTGTKLKTSATVSANFKSPFDFSLSILEAAEILSFLDSTNTTFATLDVPFSPAKSDQTAGTLSTSFSNATLAMVAGQDTSFQNFFKSLTLSSSYTVVVKGSLNAIANTAIGNLTINNVTLTEATTFTGLNGLSDIKLDSISVQSGSSAGIELAISTTIQNPSVVSIDFGADITLYLQYNGQQVASVTLPKPKLVPGPNSVTATSLFNPSGSAAIAQGRALLSNFLGGETSEVSIVGTSSSVPYTELKPTFDGLTITSSLPGQSSHIVASTALSMEIPSPTMKTALGIAYLYVNNPFQVSLAIDHVVGEIWYNGVALGSIDQDFTSNPLTVPPSSTNYKVGPVTASVQLGMDALDLVVTALSSASGTGTVQLNSTLVASVGDYTTTIDYVQDTIVSFY
ncbi:hypothetical protein HK405_004772 [Cladochytrium tenue]|nr:hypothetical protein HK405_004772 [Cladochytrium tenue]